MKALSAILLCIGIAAAIIKAAAFIGSRLLP